MVHRIVWCSVATVDAGQRPRSRILHPIWEWDDDRLIGWIGTGPTATKREHLDTSPYVSTIGPGTTTPAFPQLALQKPLRAMIMQDRDQILAETDEVVGSHSSGLL